MIHYKIINLHNLEDYNKYYPILIQWWQEKDWTIQPAELLSSTGVMVFKDDKPICAGWLYSTDSLMCLIGNVISSRDNGKVKYQAIKFLLEKLIEEARKRLNKAVLFFVTVDSIAKIAKKNGFIESNQKAHELIKLI